jgi:uncharacterized membrane protein HdeD (DUF308 family)
MQKWSNKVKRRLSMLAALADQWGLLLFRGVIAVLFGIAAFLWPGLTLVALVALFGAYALLDGVAALVIAFQARGGPGFGSLLAEGIFGIAAAVVTFFYPGITAIALLAVIAAWAILTGVAAIVSAARLRKETSGSWVLALSGILSLVFGGLLIMRPAIGALAVAWMIATYALMAGVTLIVLAIRLRELRHTLAPA